MILVSRNNRVAIVTRSVGKAAANVEIPFAIELFSDLSDIRGAFPAETEENIGIVR